MGRLPPGQKPTPVKERLARYREELVQSGGRRVIADIGPEAATALADIMKLDDKTIRQALEDALVGHAKKLRRRTAV